MLLDRLGLALRGSRVVLTDYDLHHRLEHRTFRGPLLPRTDKDKLHRIIFNAAGTIPEMAIDIAAPGEYTLKRIPDDVRSKLMRRNIIEVDKPYLVGQAVKDHLFEAAPALASRKEVRMLLDAKDSAALWTAAKRILSVTAMVATHEIAPQFRELSEAGMISKSAPGQPLNRFVVSLAVGNRHALRTTAAQELRDFFAARMEGASTSAKAA
jgi:hypothetical protein